MDKVYNPSNVEEKWINIWQEKNLFSPKIDKLKKPFTIVIPPPNITGALHMGHALNNTLQDIVIRYHRMKGENTYWVVGTDHGGIATQNVMEKILKNEGILKKELGRKEFLNRMWKWYNECGNTILNQLKRLGCAIDFSKDNIRFTMDEERTQAVNHAFYELWKEGLIYRGKRMINWCSRCYTALSDIEVEYEEENTKLWYIKYPFEDNSGYIIVATTRPETMLGDTAVCVNPEDERYKNYIGKYVILPLVGRRIKIISDERIDMSFGSGAVKITPAHDPLDLEIAKTHNIESVVVISDEGKIINSLPKYNGLKVQKAREEIIKDLYENGFIQKEENYKHNVGRCYRCGNHIEPLVSEQWFVKTKPLANRAIEVIICEKVKFYPEKWKKMILDWLNQIEDWCISRQIWWGHQIPAYYCKKCSGDGLIFDSKGELIKVVMEKGAKPIISEQKPSICPECGGGDIYQDPDVLDTWFSSALWPFSVFGWPKKTKELDYFYPTSVLVTGYEILYLWVARMIMAGLFHMNDIPFSKVIVHGIVRDKNGQKMSKSKGNVIDPLDMMSKYGTDAMRFTIAINSIGGKDIPFSENAIIGGRNFINKLYNVGRFLLMNLKEEELYSLNNINYDLIDLSDRWIIYEFLSVLSDYKKLMDNYLISEALDKVYGFVWDKFCDWYIEITKMYLNTDKRVLKLSIALEIFRNSLKMLHPFIPFITEELFSHFKKYMQEKNNFLVDSKIINFFNIKIDNSSKDMEILMEVIKEIRTLRSEFEIHPAKEVDVFIFSDVRSIQFLEENESYIKHLAKIKNIHYLIPRYKKVLKGFAKGYEIYLVVDVDMDFEKQKQRINKEIESTLINISKWKNILSNEDFLKKAPQKEIERIRTLVEENTFKVEKLQKMISDL